MKIARLGFVHVFCLSLVLLVTVGSLAHGTTWQVTMGDDDRFHPDILTVAVGDSINWTNEDSDDHTSTSGPSDCTADGIWDSGDVGPGLSWARPFTVAGTFPYFCMHHCPFGMYATVIVENPTPTTQATWGQVKAVYR